MKLCLISLSFLLVTLVSADEAPWKFKLLYENDYWVTTSYRHGKFAYKHNGGSVTISTQHNRTSSLGEFMVLKADLKKKNLSFAVEPLDEKPGQTCKSASSEHLRDLVHVCQGLLIRELNEAEKKQMQKIKGDNPVTKEEPFKIAYDKHQMRTESSGMLRFLVREAFSKFYVDAIGDNDKGRMMWLPESYREKSFTIEARTSGENWRVNCHFTPFDDLPVDQCVGDVNLLRLSNNSPDLPSVDESKVKFIFDNDFMISEGIDQELIQFNYYQFQPALGFTGSVNRNKAVHGSATFKDEENLHKSVDYKDTTFSVVVEIWPRTADNKKLDCKKEASEAYRKSLIICEGNTLVRELNEDEKRQIEEYKNSVKDEKNPFKIVFHNNRIKTYSASMSWLQVDTINWDAKTSFKVKVSDYIKYEPIWKDHSLSFNMPDKDAKREFVVERASEGTECEKSPLKDLITDCKGKMTIRALREEEKLN